MFLNKNFFLFLPNLLVQVPIFLNIVCAFGYIFYLINLLNTFSQFIRVYLSIEYILTILFINLLYNLLLRLNKLIRKVVIINDFIQLLRAFIILFILIFVF